ncbi:MAG: polysaccharide biosynthesis protein [Rhodocyclales bacterium GT-UBC]|nr:MAG: polysaccharide biosynthesis protein [Rhodocyclales bacterium GT-UBC]
MTNLRTTAAFLHDLFAAALAWGCAFWLRFNFDVPAEFIDSATRSLLWVIPLYGGLFLAFGLYRGVWRFASILDLQHILSAVAVGMVLMTASVFFLGFSLIPRSVLILHPLLLSLIMGGSRFLYRSWKEHRLYGPAKLRGQPVLVLGVDDAADSLLRELSRSGLWYAVAVVDENPAKVGRRLRGLPVLGPLSSIGDIAEKYGVKHVILALPNARSAERRRVTELASAAGLTVLTMPSYSDLLAGRFSISNIRRIELEDLLGREEVSLDDRGLNDWLAGRVVLVSGAGGSIGSELCRQIAKFSPARLVLLDSSEFALYRISDELARMYPELSCGCWAGDVRCRERVREIFDNERPVAVFHAAAYKHVPLMERVNAWQAVLNNVLGTFVIASEAQVAGVDKFVLISTDKAVNPTNVMGATKRLAERLCRAIQSGGRGGTRFVTVRFGNVLGSNGSVIPKFREQIARGGPITVTHPDIVRYFMTIPEAAQLVLQAGYMGHGGEIFVLDMGEPVKIVDLARDMIRLSGLTEEEIQIRFSGLRPGEKLFEELLADDEATMLTPHPKLRIAKLADSMDETELDALLEWLKPGVRESDEVKEGLKRFVPEYVAS